MNDDQLKQRFLALQKKTVFQPGDIVRWKEGLSNRKLPGVDQMAVVTRIPESPILASEDSGSQYFNEPLDIVVGLFVGSGEFCEYHQDSRRFELVEARV